MEARPFHLPNESLHGGRGELLIALDELLLTHPSLLRRLVCFYLRGRETDSTPRTHRKLPPLPHQITEYRSCRPEVGIIRLNGRSADAAVVYDFRTAIRNAPREGPKRASRRLRPGPRNRDVAPL